MSAENVLLNSRDPGSITFTAKIADFGFARRLDEDYSGTSPSGNYAYTAPEVLKGREHSQVLLTYSTQILFLHQAQYANF